MEFFKELLFETEYRLGEIEPGFVLMILIWLFSSFFSKKKVKRDFTDKKNISNKIGYFINNLNKSFEEDKQPSSNPDKLYSPEGSSVEIDDVYSPEGSSVEIDDVYSNEGSSAEIDDVYSSDGSSVEIDDVYSSDGSSLELNKINFLDDFPLESDQNHIPINPNFKDSTLIQDVNKDINFNRRGKIYGVPLEKIIVLNEILGKPRALNPFSFEKYNDT